MSKTQISLNNNNDLEKIKEGERDGCGMGSFQPSWAQRLADPKVYLLIFCILAILQGAYSTYTIGIISTIEKRYSFDSKTSGLILIADNISPIVSSIILGYYGGKIHRPRMVTFGMLMLVVSCILSAMPYFVYGPGMHLLSKKIMSQNGTKHELCDPDDLSSLECKSNNPRLESTIPAVTLLFLGSFVSGLGGSAFYTAGISYLDDNVKKKDSPLFFSIAMALRLFGPSLGFLLSSYSLSKFESPSIRPGSLTPRDPRWVGAWWLGFVILGVLLFIFSIPMAFFPHRLKKAAEAHKKKPDSKLPKLKDIPKAVTRLLKNSIFMCHCLSVIFHCNGILGYYILMPRYMEAHFRQTASRANLVSGSTSIITMLVGIVVGGFVIRRFRPRPRFLTGYMVFINTVGMLSILVVMFLSCAPAKMAAPEIDNKLALINSCNENCGCSTRVYQPLCSANGEYTYFSPCHAGCTGSRIGIDPNNTSLNKTYFTGCACAESSPVEEELIGGYCPFNCNMFMVFIIVLCVAKLIGSTGRVGGTIITLRCIDPKDKALALGFTSCVASLFAFIPYPLIYGALADSSCLVWEKTCGKKGNCWHYDIDKLRLSMHGLTIAFVSVGILFDIIVFFLSNRLQNLYEEDNDDPTEDEKKIPLDGEFKRVKDDDEDVLFMRRFMPMKSASSNSLGPAGSFG